MNQSLYEVRVSALLNEVCKTSDATLSDVPSCFFESLSEQGIDMLYLLGVWKTGHEGINHSIKKLGPENAALAVSSPFAITDYSVNELYGGSKSLIEFKKRANAYNIKVVIDFVPNHFAVDHRWTLTQPWLFVQGSEAEVLQFPDRYFRVTLTDQTVISMIGSNSVYLAHGRDPYSGGWQDTVQLNYYHPLLRKRVIDTLIYIASNSLADGVRCDMAMLLLPDVFKKTWPLANDKKPLVSPHYLETDFLPVIEEFEVPLSNSQSQIQVVETDFWSDAISQVHKKCHDFIFLAEVYWDREKSLLEAGFQFCYDKQLYDRLLLPRSSTESVYNHLRQNLQTLPNFTHFIENHDEKRILEAHRGGLRGAEAAAVIAYTCPGLRFYHDGMFSGRKIHHSMHVGPRPTEAESIEALSFYNRLLQVLRRREFKYGHWHLGAVTPSKDANDSWKSLFVSFVTPALLPKSSSRDISNAPSEIPSLRSSGGVGNSSSDVVQTSSLQTQDQSVQNRMQLQSSSSQSIASGSGTTLSSLSSSIVPDFVALSNVGKSTNNPSPTSSISGRIYCILVNNSDRVSNGHILFSRGDESAYRTSAGSAAADLVASIPRGQLNFSGFNGAFIGENKLGSVPVQRIAFIDQLSTYTKEYPAAHICADGFWVELQPWEKYIFEVRQLVEK
jgi:glycosidase